MILSNDEALGKKINSAAFPGLQGGPLMHVIAAKAVASLTRAPGERTRGVLLHALGHPDGRVVANAIEALGKRDGGEEVRSFLGRARHVLQALGRPRRQSS